MNKLTDYAKWTLNHAWVILVAYLISMMVLLLIHGAFGFSMADDGTYLSNALMHIGSGFVLALGTGIIQWDILKKHFPVSVAWIVSLIIGFVVAESAAGIILWKLEIYRGLINVISTDIHYPEALIFAASGLIAGLLQFRLLKPYRTNRAYWILSSTLGWGILILSTYLSPIAFVLGAVLYGVVTGFAFYRLLKPKALNGNLT